MAIVAALGSRATSAAVAAALVVRAVIAADAVAVAGQEEADVDEANTAKRIKITWVRSMIGYPQDQRDTLKTLGLNRLNQTVERPDSPQLRGQIYKVKHLLRVEE